MRALVPTIVILWCAACGEFDRQDQIKDLRILGASTTPAELFYDAAITSGGSFTPPLVTLDVFAFDPRGGRGKASVDLCAPDTDRGCIHVGDIDSGIADDDPAGRIQAVLSIELSADDILSFLPTFNDAASFSFTTLTPTFEITVQNPDATGVARESATKRLPLTLDLASLPAPLERQVEATYGVPLCAANDPSVLVPGLASCVARRKPNQPPLLVGFNIGEGKPATTLVLADSADAPTHATVSIRPGDAIRIDPVFSEDSVEMYQVQTRDLTAGTLGLENRQETLSAQWTATEGDVERATTEVSDAEDAELGLGNIWASVEGQEPGATAAIIVVVFDQRGAQTLGQIDVVYR